MATREDLFGDRGLVHSIFIMQLGRQVNDLEFKIAMLKCSIEMMKEGGADDEAD